MQSSYAPTTIFVIQLLKHSIALQCALPVEHVSFTGIAEFAGLENDGLKMTDWKMTE